VGDLEELRVVDTSLDVLKLLRAENAKVDLFLVFRTFSFAVPVDGKRKT
jgi:hypothetical protein